MKVQIIEPDENLCTFIKQQVELCVAAADYIPPPAFFTRNYLDDLIAEPGQVLIWDLKLLQEHNLNVIEYLSSKEVKSKIILLISDSHFGRMKDLIEMGICSIVTKPLTAAKLKQALTLAVTLCQNEMRSIEYSNVYKVTSGSDTLYLHETDLVIVQAACQGCRVTLRDGRVLVLKESVSDLEQRMYSQSLLKLDKDIIINLDYISGIVTYEAAPECRFMLNNAEEVSIALSTVAISLLQKMAPAHFPPIPVTNVNKERSLENCAADVPAAIMA